MTKVLSIYGRQAETVKRQEKLYNGLRIAQIERLSKLRKYKAYYRPERMVIINDSDTVKAIGANIM